MIEQRVSMTHKMFTKEEIKEGLVRNLVTLFHAVTKRQINSLDKTTPFQLFVIDL